MSDEVRWLDASQQQLWRRWLAVQALMPIAVHRGLQQESELSGQDYVVLVVVSEAPEQRIRVTDIARDLYWERSRVSHQVSRMEKRGLLERRECGEDGRGSFVGLTKGGRTAIGGAAPGHVALVRRVLFDALSEDQLEALTGIVDVMVDRLSHELGAYD